MNITGGEEKRKTDEQKAEWIVGEELRKRRWSEMDLKQRRKTDAMKVQIAARLRRETVQTLDWIAQRLQMGCRHTLANCLKRARKKTIAGTDPSDASKPLAYFANLPLDKETVKGSVRADEEMN